MEQKFSHLKLLTPLPTYKVPEPWQSTLQQIASATNIPILNNPALQKHIDLSDQDWWIALWWVIRKKWDKKVKFPAKRKYVKSLELWGELFFRTLELCIACHEGHPQSQERYPDPASWYLELMKEAKRLDLQAILENEPVGKTPFVRSRRDIIRSLKDLKNPANPETVPHCYNLMEAALCLETDDTFLKKYWRPYLHAISSWNQLLDTEDCQEWFVEEDRLVRRAGKGRARLTVFKATGKNYL